MPQPENSRVVYTRAVNEAGICCSLLHPNVITTYAHDMKAVDIKGCQGSCSPMNAAEWKLFLVQELCDGSLMDLLENDAFTLLESDLPNYEVLTNSLIEVAQGCEYIHSKGIIHGDLKLENVLAKLNNTSPNGFRVKISDFGLAALIGVDQTHISNFRHG